MSNRNSHYVYNLCKQIKNRDERISEIDDAIKNKKISHIEGSKIKKKLVKKPSAYLVYCVLKKYSNFNNRLTREDIIQKIYDDYGIKIKSKDTISSAIEEIGFINYIDLKENSFDKLEETVIVKAGKTGFFLLDSEKLSLGEISFIMNSILASNSLTKDETKKFVNKILKLNESDVTFHDILKIKSNFVYNPSLIKNMASSTLEKLAIITRAKEQKKDISFLAGEGYLHDDAPKAKEIFSKKRVITMTPYYLFCKDERQMVLGSVANPSFDYRKSEDSTNRKYLLFIAYVQNMEKVQILDTNTPLKLYSKMNLDFLVSQVIQGRAFIKEGVFTPEEFKIENYWFACGSKRELKIAMEFFNIVPAMEQEVIKKKFTFNYFKELKDDLKSFPIVHTMSDVTTLGLVSGKYNLFTNAYCDRQTFEAFLSLCKTYKYNYLVYYWVDPQILTVAYYYEDYIAQLENEDEELILKKEKIINFNEHLAIFLLAFKRWLGYDKKSLEAYIKDKKLVEETLIIGKEQTPKIINYLMEKSLKFFDVYFKDITKDNVLESLSNSQLIHLHSYLSFEELSSIGLDLNYLNSRGILSSFNGEQKVDTTDIILLGRGYRQELVTTNILGKNILITSKNRSDRLTFISSILRDCAWTKNNYNFLIFSDKVGLFKCKENNSLVVKEIKDKKDLMHLLKCYKELNLKNIVFVIEDLNLTSSQTSNDILDLIHASLLDNNITLIYSCDNENRISADMLSLFTLVFRPNYLKRILNVKVNNDERLYKMYPFAD